MSSSRNRSDQQQTTTPTTPPTASSGAASTSENQSNSPLAQVASTSSPSSPSNTNNSNMVCEMGALLPFGRPTVAEDGATMMLDTSTAAGALLACATSLA